MEKSANIFWITERKYKQLAEINGKAIDKYNKNTLSALLPIGWSLALLPLTAALFNVALRRAIFAYALMFALYFVLFLLFQRSSAKKHALAGLYVSFTILFLLGIYLSIVQSPHMQATILLGGFVIMPLTIVDRPRRINLFLVFWLAVHTILAFFFKPNNALVDLLNCLCSIVLGGYLGNALMQVRLESFEATRQLIIEKETDMLTGLFNRRKLFETLAVIESPNSEKPSGIMMIDIDYFKDFNDKYGHAAGDKCLSHLGEIFKKVAQNYKMDFYRYGGEEFVALVYGYSKADLLSIAENLRIAVQNADMDSHNFTVSIGIAYCGEKQIRNYGNIIDQADKAVYAAKRMGRNIVCMEQKANESND